MISERDAAYIEKVKSKCQLDKCVCRDKALYWITYDTLEALRSIGIEPTILKQRELLPVFHCKDTEGIEGYDPGLSVYALALIWAVLPSPEDDMGSLFTQWIYQTLYGGDKYIKLFLEDLEVSLKGL